jgi:hypothetical protein
VERTGRRGYSLPPADPYARQVLWTIASGYTSTFDDPDWSLHPKLRIKVVDFRATPADADTLKSSYRFLDPRLTDFLLDGFNDITASDLFD